MHSIWLLLLVAAPLSHAVRLTDQELTHLSADGGNLGNASYPGCVSGVDSIFCRGDGYEWLSSTRECCKGRDYITCKEGKQDFCRGPDWKYLGRGNCCTSKWTDCTPSAKQDFCRGDGFDYLGSGMCCTTSSQKVWLTCETGKQDFCRGRFKYLGGGLCCTTEWSHCIDGAKQDFCTGDGYTYIGGGKCCASDPWQKPTCYENYGSESKCTSQYGKYVGGGGCCWSKR
mmetsp:Transcript_43968/g.80345  ORF Transcript_43968/g.80345 Transcript_43968/m.80345 type:complete len:228 (-) Transcript_43968:39-722(-)